MTNPIKTTNGGSFTGKHMLIIMVAFFGTILSVNILMAVLATRSWTGLVVKNSYVASQGFNEKLAAARKQNKLGWREVVSYQDNNLELFLEDATKAPVILSEVFANIGRPAFEQEDRKIELTHIGGGHYRNSISLSPGQWQVRIRGNHEAGSYRVDKRFIVPTIATGEQ